MPEMTAGVCPRCGNRLDGQAVDGLCAQCLLDPSWNADLGAGRSDPSRIGRYKLLDLLGEGGFGSVYSAVQEHPVSRRVALKIIKPGMDTRQVVARFEAERQALAMMDHPNIAKILDAGETDAGRPYFVMELVAGTPITRYCDENGLDTRERLELFTQVCRAIQHAHQKAVIHRDIKPNNVLVTVHEDGKPLPKVIDFGIAKATGAKLTDKTLFTEFRQFIGTPEYMSPEQAGAADVDTRTDTYSLGVLLYELLTGTTPFGRAELRDKTHDEIQRIIREVEPPEPSARLGALAGEAASAAAATRKAETLKLARRVKGDKAETLKLARRVKGDLDWVVMRCLEKDPTRRYETVNGLASDVERFLRGDPVSAGPPSAAYRARKFARKHRWGLAAAGAVAASLLLLGAAITIGVLREGRQRGAHVVALQAEQAKTLGEKRAAIEARDEAQAVNDFLLNMLAAADPWGRNTDPTGPTRTAGLTVRAVLDSAAGQLARGSLGSRPGVEAAVRTALASAYRGMGLYPQAEIQAREALGLRRQVVGDKHPDVATSLTRLANVLYDKGDLGGAEGLYRQALRMRTELLTEQHPDTAASMTNLGNLMRAKGDLRGAEDMHRRALGFRRKLLGESHADVASSLHNLATVLHDKRDLGPAETLYLDSLAMKRELLGERHPLVAETLNNLANLRRDTGDLRGAEAMHRQALDMRRTLLGERHPDVVLSLGNLALVLDDEGEHAQAEELRRGARELREASLRPAEANQK